MSIGLGTIAEFVNRAALQTGFERGKYVDGNLPTTFSNLVVVLFLGDLRSEHIFSSLLLHHYLSKVHPGKYVILCSWPGHSGLFNYCDEYWSVSDNLSLRELADSAIGFNNRDKRFDVYARNLRKYFENVVTWEDLLIYYDNGLTSTFLQKQEEIIVYRPGVTAASLEARRLLNSKSGDKLFIHPVRVGHHWGRGEDVVKFKQDFWVELCNKLIANDITPVIWQDYSAYDLSSIFGDKCVYVSDSSITNVMGVMRMTGCVLDIYDGVSRLAIAACCPFIACVQRKLYSTLKDWEINDLTITGFPYKYIFSFPTIIESGSYRETIDNIINVWNGLATKIKHVSLPAADESYSVVSYGNVREHKVRRVGLKFIKVERMDIG